MQETYKNLDFKLSLSEIFLFFFFIFFKTHHVILFRKHFYSIFYYVNYIMGWVKTINSYMYVITFVFKSSISSLIFFFNFFYLKENKAEFTLVAYVWENIRFLRFSCSRLFQLT